MSNIHCVRGAFALALASLTGAAAHAVIITDNFVATEAAVINGLVPLDLSGIVSGLTTNNSYTANFTSSFPGAFTGTLTATVYGNVGAPGLALNSVVIVYNFRGNGPSGLETFEFGVDSSNNLDYSDLLAATHGTIGDGTTLGQLSPTVNLTNNILTNDTLFFDFNAVSDTLGGVGFTEDFSWYIRTDGAVQVGFVDTVVTDFGATVVPSLAFIDAPGQPDLNIPAPGAIASLGLAAAAGLRRRRRD